MSFVQKIKLWRGKVDKQLMDQKREIILRLFRAVIYDTPVLEGTLRANWRASPNNPETSAIEYRPVSAVMDEIQDVLNGSRLSDTIFLRNNLPYAYAIEYLGHSSVKAPQGMVRKNVVRFNTIARQVIGSSIV